MNILTDILFSNKTRVFKKNYQQAITRILEEYSQRNISIVECLSKISPLTADLILIVGSEVKSVKKVYDSILIIVANLYGILQLERETEFYTVNKEQTSKRVSALMKDVLRKTQEKTGFKTDDLDTAIRKSDVFTAQLVEAHYRAGREGCHRFVTSSIYSVLLSADRNLTMKRSEIENTVRAILAEEYFRSDNEKVELSLEYMR